MSSACPSSSPFVSTTTFGKPFVTIDRMLDQARCGPLFSETTVARLILASIEYVVEIGPPHPSCEPVEVLGSPKAVSAKRALLLRRIGHRLGPDEQLWIIWCVGASEATEAAWEAAAGRGPAPLGAGGSRFHKCRNSRDRPGRPAGRPALQLARHCGQALAYLRRLLCVHTRQLAAPLQLLPR